jgi:hypothetical protein
MRGPFPLRAVHGTARCDPRPRQPAIGSMTEHAQPARPDEVQACHRAARRDLQRSRKEVEMSTTVTGNFESNDQMRNVKDDLVASGIPAEKIYVDETARTIKVIMPVATRPTIVEIFERHGLDSVTA